MAGETVEEALRHVKNINEQGISAAIDVLGEHITDVEEVQNITEQYCDVYGQINHESLDCNLVIKPTHLGLMISLEEEITNFATILNQATKCNHFLRIAYGKLTVHSQTINIYKHCKRNYETVGVVIQSYRHT